MYGKMAFLRPVLFAFCALTVSGQTNGTCTSMAPEGFANRCINIRDCPPLMEILPQATSNADVANYLRSTQCGFEGSEPKVCCPRGSSPPPRKDERQYPEDYCGVTNLKLGKIVGGDDAGLGDLPWMALLGYTGRDEVETGSPEWRCGGVLISASHILTAAHCVDGRLYLVRLGELDLASDKDGASPVDYRIALKILHPEYDALALVSDIAVLKLQEKAKFNDLILPICLPLSPQLRSNNFVRYRPLIAGWGSLKHAGDTASKLQMVQLPVTSTAECQQAYSRHMTNVVDERVICAGYVEGGRDSCDGDSGGPLMQPMPDPVTQRSLWYVIGVLAYGVRCAEPGYPSVHVRVTAYVPWIQQQLAQ